MTCFECNKHRVIAQRIASDMVEKSNKIAELEDILLELQHENEKLQRHKERSLSMQESIKVLEESEEKLREKNDTLKKRIRQFDLAFEKVNAKYKKYHNSIQLHYTVNKLRRLKVL